MNPARIKLLSDLQTRIDYQFSKPERLDLALTHSSARAPNAGNYERLEFLGDRVLGFCIAELLFGRFGDAPEGELSVRLNNLVSAEACAKIADEISLHDYIIVGSDVQNIKAKSMLNIRADVVEALVAAIYLDGGLDGARGFILKYWTPHALAKTSFRRDAKTELQEWAHAKFKQTPSYKIIAREGPDHAPDFTIEVKVAELPAMIGQGGSKRAAEQNAAQGFLLREGIWSEDET